jgi:Asp-tRNA(Asn)/Glu-tRNA(Gln) amidotransferase A subunit family amidase
MVFPGERKEAMNLKSVSLGQQMSELHYLSATELAEAFASRQVSSVEATRHFISRIEAGDGERRRQRFRAGTWRRKRGGPAHRVAVAATRRMSVF